MSWAGRSTGLLLAGLLAMTAAGCGADASSDEGSGSCALEFTYQGRTYRDVANVDFTVSDKLGTAVKPPCDDIGGKDEAGGRAPRRLPTRSMASPLGWPSQSETHLVTPCSSSPTPARKFRQRYRN